METNQINEVLEQKLEKVKKVYNFSFIFAIIGFVFFLLFHYGKGSDHLFAWLAACIFSIHSVVFFFFSRYQIEIHKYQKKNPGAISRAHMINVILQCIIVFYSAGRFLTGFASVVILLVVLALQYIPMVLGTGWAIALIKNLTQEKV